MGQSIIPLSVLPKVASLVRMLASPVDGEVLGAARALGRTLAGTECDLHDLADLIAHVATPVSKPRRRATPRPPQARPTWPASRRRDIGAKLRAGLHSGAFTSWEAKFAADIADHIEREGRRTFSPKQAATVEQLVAKASRWSAAH